jgi:hypothetical protein
VGLSLKLRVVDGEAVFGAQVVDLAVLDELVGPADADHRNGAAHLVEASITAEPKPPIFT